MKKHILFLILILSFLSTALIAQTGRYGAVVVYGDGLPAYTPSKTKRDAFSYVDNLTGIEWYYIGSATWEAGTTEFRQSAAPVTKTITGGYTYSYAKCFWIDTDDGVTYKVTNDGSTWESISTGGSGPFKNSVDNSPATNASTDIYVNATITSGNQTGNAVSLIPTTKKVIVGNRSVGTFGAYVYNDTRATGDYHAFEDWATLNFTDAGLGYASFDAKPTSSPTSDYNHLVGYQSRLTKNGTANITNYINAYDSRQIINGGTIADWNGYHAKDEAYSPAIITNRQGVKIDDIVGTAAVTNNYGLKIGNIAKGTTINNAIYTDGGLVRLNQQSQTGSNIYNLELSRNGAANGNRHGLNFSVAGINGADINMITEGAASMGLSLGTNPTGTGTPLQRLIIAGNGEQKMVMNPVTLTNTPTNSYNTLTIENTTKNGINFISNDNVDVGIRWNSATSGAFGGALLNHNFSTGAMAIGTNQTSGTLDFRTGSYVSRLSINNTGVVTIGNLAGTGERFVKTSSTGVLTSRDEYVVNATLTPANNTTATINYNSNHSVYQLISAPLVLTIAYTNAVIGSIHHIAIAPISTSTAVTFTGFTENGAAVTTKTFTGYTVLTIRQITTTSAEIIGTYTPSAVTMQSGTTAAFAGISTASNGTPVSVTFSTAFATTPKITLTPSAQVFCWITAKSASGFTCNCRNDSGVSQAPTVDWIATQ